jgi:hypothetical protein
VRQREKPHLLLFLLLFDRHLYLEGFGCLAQAFVYDVDVDVLGSPWDSRAQAVLKAIRDPRLGYIAK